MSTPDPTTLGIHAADLAKCASVTFQPLDFEDPAITPQGTVWVAVHVGVCRETGRPLALRGNQVRDLQSHNPDGLSHRARVNLLLPLWRTQWILGHPLELGRP